MTEAEWLACRDLNAMLQAQRKRASRRRLRLFAVACCRRILPILGDERSRDAVTLAERSADEPIPEGLLDAASAAADAVFQDAITDEDGEMEDQPGVNYYQHAAACAAASYAPNSLIFHDQDVTQVADAVLGAVDDEAAERRRQADLLRDIFGNPYRNDAFDLAWRTPTAVNLAEAIYADYAFDRLPILADALEDAGCTNRDILDHCRQPGEHVRGCWVVDLVLGKS